MRSDLAPEDYRALARFRHLLRCFLTFSRDAARAAGLPPHQHQLLLAVKGLPAGQRATVSAVAFMLQRRHHSTVGLIDRLAARGLAKRTRSGKDRREVLVSVTPKGERLLRQLSILHREELRRIFSELVGALLTVKRGLAP